MRNRVEYILGGMTILQGLLVGGWHGMERNGHFCC